MENIINNINPKEGFVMVKHGLYDWLMSNKLREPRLRIILAVIRLTDGWNEKEAIISERCIARMTKIDHRNAGKYIKELLNKKILFRRASGKIKCGKPTYFYRINGYLRHMADASKENCHPEDASAGVSDTAKIAVCDTAIKDIKEIKNWEVPRFFDTFSMCSYNKNI
ncbi:MAG: replication protein [Patescibacteria group bacterium]|jgi:phage replication O-like protein O